MVEDKRVRKSDFASDEEFYAAYPHAFKTGQSGNPAGRPSNISNRKTVRQIAQEMDFCPIETAIDLVKMDAATAREKYKLDAPVSTSQKTKLTMWIGDKMHSSLRSESLTVIEGCGPGEDGGILQIVQLPPKQVKEEPVEIPIEAAKELCKAEDPLTNGEE